MNEYFENLNKTIKEYFKVLSSNKILNFSNILLYVCSMFKLFTLKTTIYVLCRYYL